LTSAGRRPLPAIGPVSDRVIGRNGIHIEPDLDDIDTYRKAGEIANCAGDGRCGYKSRPELALACARMLTETAYDGSTYNLHAALDSLSAYEAAAGRPHQGWGDYFGSLNVLGTSERSTCRSAPSRKPCFIVRQIDGNPSRTRSTLQRRLLTSVPFPHHTNSH